MNTSEISQYYRLIIIGNISVGKTSLLNRLTDDFIKEKYKATVGVDYRTKEILINHEKIKLEIWDTAGQERFKALTVKYYQKADGIIIAFSVDDYSSFQLLDSWINGAKANSMNASLILVGCKCDIDNDKRVVSKHEAIMFAQKHGIQYIETSARENINILLIFEEITRTIKVNEGIRPIIPSIVLTPLSKNEKKICNC